MYIIKFISTEPDQRKDQYFSNRIDLELKQRENINYARRFKSLKRLRAFFKYKHYDEYNKINYNETRSWICTILYIKE